MFLLPIPCGWARSDAAWWDGAESCDCRSGDRVRNQVAGMRARLLAPSKPADGSRRDLDDFFGYGGWNRFAMLLNAGEVTFDCVLDIGHGFSAGLALRDTSRQRGTFCHENAVLVRLYEHTKFHGTRVDYDFFAVNPHSVNLWSMEGIRTFSVYDCNSL